MAFEEFKFMDRALRSKVTIRETGHIGFSNGAINRLKINEFGFCKLYFNKEENKVGMKLIDNEKSESKTKIIKRKNNYYISSRPFFDYYGISYRPSRSFIAIEDEESGLIVIDLNKPLPSKKLKRKGEQEMDNK